MKRSLRNIFGADREAKSEERAPEVEAVRATSSERDDERSAEPGSTGDGAVLAAEQASGSSNGYRVALHFSDDPIAVVEQDEGRDEVLEAPDATIEAARRDRVVASLLDKEIVTRAQAREAGNKWQREGEKDALWRVLAAHPEVNSEAVYAEAARMYAFREAEIVPDEIDEAFVIRVVESFPNKQQDRLLELGLFPLEREIDPQRGVLKLVFATHDPTRPDLLRFIQDLNLDHFELRYAPQRIIDPLLDEVFPRRNEFLDLISEDEWAQAVDLGTTVQSASSQVVDEEKLDAEINRSALINLFEAALVESVRRGASDIHIFPNPRRETEFHFRLDGELQLWHTEDKVHPEALLSVVKDRSMNVDRFEKEAAQDGFIQRDVDGTLIRYRVSVLPLASANRQIRAESIVIRVLDDRKVFSDLSYIGLLPGALARFKEAVRQPYGMVILTGPTGSGKSTTLVAALHHVIRPQVNVLSIEDPVEYVIPGARQIKLGPRLHLEGALRSVLRHDPDVVMVGEMRDRATAELAIKLANTGHLTFSTLHTNDAPSAVARLYKMGIEPFLIAYAINLIVAQRLLRTLCPDCKEEENDPDPVLLKELGFSEEELLTTQFHKPGRRPKCRTCHGVGYKGRRAISEALYLSRDIRHLIVESRDNIDEDAIRQMAIAQGMLTLLASAREIVKMGHTSIEEVIRIVATGD